MIKYSDFLHESEIQHKSISYNLLTPKPSKGKSLRPEKITVDAIKAFSLVGPYTFVRILDQIGVITVIGHETNDSVKDTYATLQLDMIAVKGKKEAVTIYTLAGDSVYKETSEFKNLKTKHEKILENYFGQKWEACLNEMQLAKRLCNHLMNDYYEIMTERIKEFQKSPPPKEWDGVYVATSK